MSFFEIPDPLVGHLTIGKGHWYNHPKKVTFPQVYWFMFMFILIVSFFTDTHPETNSSHLKIGPNPKLAFQPSIFRYDLLVS